MRQSKNEVDIDEIPIPTAGEGPKTFEELLAEKMEAEQELGMGSGDNLAEND